MSGLWQCVSIEIELEGYIISNLFSELTITPDYNIADIQHSLSTRPGVCNLLFINRYMRPEGPWQRLAAALADSSGVFIHSLILAQTDNRQF